MKKLVSIVVFLAMVLSIQAQNLGLFAGVNMMDNYPFQESNDHYYTHFSPKVGYSFGLELDDIRIVKIPIKFTGKIVKYNGGISHESSGLGGSYNFDVNQENYYLSMGLHLLKNKSSSPLQLSLGVEYSILLSEKFTGSTKTWSTSTAVENKTIDENSFDLNMKNKFAIIGTIGYKKEIMTGWFIEPQFSVLAGFTEELQLFDPVYALKFLLEFGISKKL
jgi:hypothetical protein